MTTREVVMQMNKEDFIKVYAGIAERIQEDENTALRKIWKYEEIKKECAKKSDYIGCHKAGDAQKRLYKEIEDCKNAIKEWKPIIEFFFGLDI